MTKPKKRALGGSVTVDGVALVWEVKSEPAWGTSHGDIGLRISIMKYDVPVVYPYALGYTPCVLLLMFFNVWGYLEANEDKILIQQRITRGRIADAEVGITKRPSWWSKACGDHHLDDLQQLRGMVEENNIHSNQQAKRNRQIEVASFFL